MVVGLLTVKWMPYFHKTLVAAAQHSIGPSILAGGAPSAPAGSWSAAAGYAVNYMKAVRQAWVLGILAGAAVQTLIPKNWVARLLGASNWRSAALAGLAALPSMM